MANHHYLSNFIRKIALLMERRAAFIAAAVTGRIAVPNRVPSLKKGAAREN
jgi:hypothetical protein